MNCAMDYCYSTRFLHEWTQFIMLFLIHMWIYFVLTWLLCSNVDYDITTNLTSHYVWSVTSYHGMCIIWLSFRWPKSIRIGHLWFSCHVAWQPVASYGSSTVFSRPWCLSPLPASEVNSTFPPPMMPSIAKTFCAVSTRIRLCRSVPICRWHTIYALALSQ